VIGLFHAILVTMRHWAMQYHVFVAEAYFKNGEAAVTTQQLFCTHFNIPHHGYFPT
jgi:hypothetical protein